MRGLYRWDRIGPQTRCTGHRLPVAHSMSPAIFNAAFDDSVWMPSTSPCASSRLRGLCEFIDGCTARRGWARRCSVTIPHKRTCSGTSRARWDRRATCQTDRCSQHVAHSAGREPAGSSSGGVQRLSTGGQAARRELGRKPPVAPGESASLGAYNTDYRGAMDALCAGIGCTPMNWASSQLLPGAGGSAGRSWPVCATAVSRDHLQSHAGRPSPGRGFGRGPAARAGCDHRADVIINAPASACGRRWMTSPFRPMPWRLKNPSFSTPSTTHRNSPAARSRRRGCRTVDGVSMFVSQAAAQFERWIGGRPRRHYARHPSPASRALTRVTTRNPHIQEIFPWRPTTSRDLRTWRGLRPDGPVPVPTYEFLQQEIIRWRPLLRCHGRA